MHAIHYTMLALFFHSAANVKNENKTDFIHHVTEFVYFLDVNNKEAWQNILD